MVVIGNCPVDHVVVTRGVNKDKVLGLRETYISNYRTKVKVRENRANVSSPVVMRASVTHFSGS